MGVFRGMCVLGIVQGDVCVSGRGVCTPLDAEAHPQDLNAHPGNRGTRRPRSTLPNQEAHPQTKRQTPSIPPVDRQTFVKALFAEGNKLSHTITRKKTSVILWTLYTLHTPPLGRYTPLGQVHLQAGTPPGRYPWAGTPPGQVHLPGAAHDGRH